MYSNFLMKEINEMQKDMEILKEKNKNFEKM